MPAMSLESSGVDASGASLAEHPAERIEAALARQERRLSEILALLSHGAFSRPSDSMPCHSQLAPLAYLLREPMRNATSCGPHPGEAPPKPPSTQDPRATPRMTPRMTPQSTPRADTSESQSDSPPRPRHAGVLQSMGSDAGRMESRSFYEGSRGACQRGGSALSRATSIASIGFHKAEDLRKERAQVVSHIDRATACRASGGELDPTPTKDSSALHQRLKTMVQSTNFEVAMGMVIILNSMSMGMEIELETISSPAVAAAFLWLEYIFTVIFFSELVLRSFAFGLRENFLGGDWYWTWFDTTVVTMAILELLITLLFAGMATDVNTNATTFRLLRLLRITRLVRVLRVSKLIRFVTPLRALLFSIVVTMRHLVWSLVLLLMLIYLFSMLFTRAMLDSFEDFSPEMQSVGKHFWGTLFRSVLTLFQAVTGGVSWNDCSTVLNEISPFLELIFAMYIAVAYFAVLNVITGTFCQSAMAAAERDPSLIAAKLAVKKDKVDAELQKLFALVDKDKSGVVTLEELDMVLHDLNVKASFHALGLEVDDAWTLFKLLDRDQTFMVDSQEFIIGCMQLAGAASTLDIAKLSYEVNWLVKKVAVLVDSMLGNTNQPAQP